MEGKYSEIKKAGLGLAAVSYDSPEVLKNFADRHHIEFPLLSDKDSAIIRKVGILNEQVKKGSSSYGIPYPGIYVLDSQGAVKAKFFENDYSERDTAGMILLQQFGITPATGQAPIPAKHLKLSVAATETNVRAGQHISLVLHLELPRDVHVYAPGVQGYIPIAWQLPDTAAIKAGAVQYPPSKVMRLEAIQESVPVYEGHVRLARTITIGSQQDVTPLLDAAGNLEVVGSFRYQACDTTKCYIPETVPVKVTLHLEALDRTRVPEEMQKKSDE